MITDLQRFSEFGINFMKEPPIFIRGVAGTRTAATDAFH